jgi:uncharacterized short protein YbdD (DUF466 family)
MRERIGRFWQALRTLAGDDAYERYKAHHAQCHRGEPVLDPRAFYLQRQRDKWGGVSRCC